MVQKKVTPGRGKNKGNRYEREQAKKLGNWMFSSPTVLYKHEDSGARKVVYTGDITPKDADNFHWSIWPFVVEVKNGYQNHIPTLMTQTLLRKWIVKLLSERTETQKIPLLICQFHHQIPILLTNIILNAYCDVSIVQEYEGKFETFYVYKYRDLLKLNFFEVMPNWFEDVVFGPPPILVEDTSPPKTSTHDQNITYNSTKKAPKQNRKKSKDEQIGEIIDQILL